MITLDPLGNFGRGGGPSEQETLRLVTATCRQEIQLLGTFDTLCDGPKSKIMGKGDNRGDKGLLVAVLVDIFNECPVDFEARDREPLEIAQ